MVKNILFLTAFPAVWRPVPASLFQRELCSSLLCLLHPFQGSQPAVSHLCPRKQIPWIWRLTFVFETFVDEENHCTSSTLDCSFVSGSYKCIHVLSIVTSRAKKPTMFHLKCWRIAFVATTWSGFWSAFKHFGIHLAESFLMSNTWWILHVPESYLQSICYLSVQNSPNCQDHFQVKWQQVALRGQSLCWVLKCSVLYLATQFLTVKKEGLFSPNIGDVS